MVIASDQGIVREEKGFNASRNGLQTSALLDALDKGKYDAALGGARRDEERATEVGCRRRGRPGAHLPASSTLGQRREGSSTPQDKKR